MTQNIDENQDNCQKELDEFKKKYTYLMAEFDNFKKRSEKETLQALFYGESLVLKDIISIIDNFERAFNQVELEVKAEKLNPSLEKHLEGFKLILKSFEKILEKYNVHEVSYQEFNPEIHEAIMKEKADNYKSGDIVKVLEKGYKHKSKLLRPAKVSIAE